MKVKKKPPQRGILDKQEQNLLLDLAPVMACDMDDKITHWAHGVELLYGFSKNEALGRVSHELLKTQFPKPLKKIQAELLRRGEWEGELVHQSKDGATVTILSQWVLQRDGKGQPVAILETNRDITKRKKAEEGLRRERDFSSAVLDTARALVVLLDRQGRITRFNRTCEALTGYSEKEVMGRKFWEFLILPEELPGVLQQWDALQAKTFPNQHENHWIAKDGSRHLISWSNTVLLQPDGQIEYIIAIGLDITELKRAEEALRENEARFSMSLEVSNGGIWEWFVNRNEVRLDDRFHAMLGYAPGELPNTLPEWLSYHHPEDIPVWMSKAQAYLRGDSPVYESEHRIRNKAGTWSWVFTRGKLVNLTTTGAEKRFIGFAIDITERKRAEDALRESEKRERHRAAELQSVLDSVPAAVWIAHDPDCQSITGNRAANKFLRVPEGGESSITAPSERRPTHFTPVKDGRPLTPDELPVQMAARGIEVRDLEHTIQFGDGTILHLLGNATPLLDETGHPRGSVAAFVDITERKKRDFFSREQANINRLIHSTLNIDEVMQTALRTAMRALGSESGAISLRKGDQWLASYAHGMPKEILGKSMNDEEERHAVLAIQTQQAVAIHDGFNDVRVNRDHMRKWNVRSVLVIPMLTRQGVIGVMFLNYHSSAHSFTQAEIDFGTELVSSLTLAMENARLYAELQQYAVRLEQTVQERTIELQNANAELEHFSHTITHDLRAPLRAMQGFASMMLEGDSAQSLSDTSKDFLKRITKASEKMTNIIKDALDLTRAARAAMQLEPVDVETILRNMLETFPNLQPPNVEIILEGTFPKVMGNETAINQCFANLLGNAVKFVAPGTKPRVRVWAEVENAKARIWVEDNGIGIPKDAQEKIFDPFEKAHSDYEGTGLGLALVSKSIEKMGGKIGVESEPGRGSRFWMEFRIAE